LNITKDFTNASVEIVARLGGKLSLVELDPEERIMLARLAKLITDSIDYDSLYTPGDFQQRTKFWRNLSNRVGISSLINPRQFEFGNFEYDPQGVLFNAFDKLRSEVPPKFNELLQELCGSLGFKKNPNLESDLNRCLSTFGLKVKDGSLVKSSLITAKRAKELRQKMFSLIQSHKAESEALQGAIERFSEGGRDAFRQSLDSCRNAVESLIKKKAGMGDWNGALNSFTKSESERTLIKQVYSFLSSRGVHGTTIPTEKDTQLGLALSEALILWVLSSEKK